MTRSKVLAGALGALAGFASTPAAQAQMTTTRVASGLSLPVFATSPPGDTRRLFIVEQGTNGTANIKILDLQTNTVLSTPFLTITGLSTGGERGLLGLAFHPDYASNGFFYVYLSDTGVSESVWRYHVSSNPDVADPASVSGVLVMADPWPNHNAGWIAFGPDHDLYIATGYGNHAQELTNQDGKILRIDVDGDDYPADPTRNYAIPPTNPFAGVPGEETIWDYGLRNPWRDSFDRVTGELYVADVGQSAFEEIDVQPAGTGGLDFGWECMEGNSCTGQNWACTCNSSALTNPIWTYDHSQGCAVMGGYVYRGNALCGMQGTYFFADYCFARIWSLRYANGVVTEFTDRTAELAPPAPLAINLISSFGEDQNGELYICDHADGELYKIVPRSIVDCNHNGIDDLCDIQSGTSLDADGDGIPDECEPFVVSACFGDGTAGACPCGNSGAPGHGCQNSAGTGGAQLSGAGQPSLSADTVVLTVTGELPTAFSICLQGDVEVGPALFGDGLRCAGGHAKRMYVRSASGGSFSVPGAGDPSLSARSAALGNPILPGTIRMYQTYYRDPSSAFCPDPPGGTFNASSGVRVRWGL